MCRKIFFFALLCACAVTGKAQKSSDPKTPGLSITWKVMTNNFEGKPQSRTLLTFKAAHNWRLPASGWKIYFNFARMIVPASVTGDVQIRHINGDFFCMNPVTDFRGLSPGKSFDAMFTSSDWLINFTDAPSGFYLIWDNAPDKFYPIDKVKTEPSTSPEQLTRVPQDQVAASTAESVFAKNQVIRDVPADSLTRIFPTPQSYQENPGMFIFNSHVKIKSDTAFRKEEQYLKETLNALLIPLKSTGANSGKVIILQQKPMAAEAYELTVSAYRVTISAGTPAGMFYGIQSLKTMMSPQVWKQRDEVISIKNVTVKDAPRFAYRAVMLDVARNFQSKKEILKLLDVMALYKLNVFHFHLTDDEGWRLEIPVLPELTSVGAHRGHTLDNLEHLQPSLGSGPDIHNESGSGYYSRADYIEILKYATERHIRVIPEIESPGHARAAVKAMDARYANLLKQGRTADAEKYLLRDLRDSSKYSSVQYWNDNVMDVSMPSVYRFINTITDEVTAMYREAGAPLATIHFGGDEVPAGAWAGSPAFKQLMKIDPAIHSTDDLWPYYYAKVADILKSHQLYLSAWEETGLVKATVNNIKTNVLNTALLNRDVHLEVWNNVLGWGAEDLAYKQANAGYRVILSCVSNLYFDMAAEKAFDEPGYYWGGYTDVEKVFKFIPFNYFKNTTEDRMGNLLNRAYLQRKEQLSAAGTANIIGLQGALWGETLRDAERLEYMMLPKLLGLAERAWAPDPAWANTTDSVNSAQQYAEAWTMFSNVLAKRELPRLDNYAGGFKYRIPQPGVIRQDNKLIVNSSLPGFKIRYTTEGSRPRAYNTLYMGSIPFNPKLKIALFNTSNRIGKVVSVENLNGK